MMDEPQGETVAAEEAATGRVKALLEISARLFATKGFEATSMRDIAAEAGVSKALLYHHFASKDDIYARISFESTQHLYSFVRARIPEEAGADQKVRAFMTAAAEFFADHRSAWIAASNAFWTDPDRQRMERRIARRRDFEHLLRQIIADGVASGEFHPVDPAIAGRLILSAINWMQRWFDPDKPLSAQEVALHYADIVLRGMTTR